MKTTPVWTDRIRDDSKTDQCIYDLCFNPVGSQLLVAAGQVVLVYSCIDGSITHTLKGHKDSVYCLGYCHDGTKFASGGADKIVIIWSSKLEPVLKYPHNDAIQCLAFNPVTNILASCAISDFSLWSVYEKSMPKFKTPSRINSCSWNIGGQFLALGLGNGNVSIRNSNGEEKFLIEWVNNSSGPPVWALSFSPERSDSETLCITDWSQRMVLYSFDGKEMSNGREFNIGFEALNICYLPLGDYILVGGCGKKCVLVSKDGINLGPIGDEQQSWIWSCKAHPTAPVLVFGCQDGTLAYYKLSFSTVHDLYKEKYIFRDNMTDVVVHHLLTNDQVRIRSKEWVKKVAIYKDRLAIQLTNEVAVYDRTSGDDNQIHYHLRGKLKKSIDCNVLIVCSEHIVFCLETQLLCFTFNGKHFGQWLMEDVIRYIKIIGGPAGNEGLIIGLANGQVLKVYLSNEFCIPIMKSKSPILCMDVNMSRRKLAIVNEDHNCIVYDLISKRIEYQEPNATGVAWNCLHEDILCYSGKNNLYIKVKNCRPYEMKFSGFVVGVYGFKAFSLEGSVIKSIDIPLCASMYQCLEKQMYSTAYEIACLGITESDWKSLAFACLEGFELELALKAFAHTKDLIYIDLIYEFMSNSDQNRDSFMGDVLAYQGKFSEASRAYQKAGESRKALSMYTDLRMFDHAQEFVKGDDSNDKKSLIRKKAEWAKNVNELKVAAEMYLAAGDSMNAIHLAIENQWVDLLMELAQKLDKKEREALIKIAEFLGTHDEIPSAVDIYKKLGEYEQILALHVNSENWPAAFSLVEKYPQFESLLYMPYARWLIKNDKFIDAQKAFHKAGKFDEATNVLKLLIENSVDEGRFDDAGYYHWILSRQFLDFSRTSNSKNEEYLQKYRFHDRLADIYYAFHAIYKYVNEPFILSQQESLFNIARYLLNETRVERPPGVTQFYILYSLAKLAKTFGGFKIARQALDYIQSLRIPPQLQELVDMYTVTMKAKPYHDNEDLLIMCYRCSSNNPVVISSSIPSGNFCANCKQPFVFSFVAFEVLPLIEFELENGISDEEAEILLQKSISYEKRLSIDIESNFQTLMIEDSAQISADLFTNTLINLENDSNKFNPVVVNRETLQSMDPSLVLICKWPKPLSYRYYKNVIPQYQMVICSSCFKIFCTDDFEMEVLQKGFCPFCRVSPDRLLRENDE